MTCRSLLCCCTLLALFVALADSAAAQVQQAPASEEFVGPTTPTDVTQKSFAVQKAQARAQQRLHRMETNRRYGVTPNRPAAVAIPFTSAHSLSWMRNGYNPYLTNRYHRPHYYYTYPYSIYR